jgi:UDP-2,3-diacylglucosamine pyrophosphatase LpxH
MARGETHHALVVSDVHLCGVVPQGWPWMRYRQPDALPDADLAALLRNVAGAARRGRFEVVLNGDFFDFDAPDPAAAVAARLPPPRPRTEAAAVALLRGILADHPAVVAALGELLRGGAALVFVAGNHDAQLALPGVQRELRAWLAAASGLAAPPVAFRAWCHRTAGGVHVEHGHQYDAMCAVDAADGVAGPGGTEVEATVGSVASHYVQAMVGSLNPYHPDPFAVRLRELAAMALAGPHRRDAGWYAAAVADAAAHLARVPASAPAAELAPAHAALFAPKARLADLGAVLQDRGHAAEVGRRCAAAAAEILRRYDARGVVFGHTHVPRGGWSAGRFVGNSGTWAPRLPHGAGAAPRGVDGAFVWLVTGADGCRGGTFRWSRAAGGVAACRPIG